MAIEKKEALDLGLQVLDTTEHLEDAKQEKINAIKKLLPEIVNSDNKLNAEKLEELLGLTNTTYKQQGYELTFAGKQLANSKASEPTEFELKLEAEQSKHVDSTNNVIIRGDNAEVLKILKKNYQNKIKMIYIDPPYNTGNDGFVYNDNFKDTESDLIEKFSLNEDSINYLHNIYGNKTHSSWLSFMYPRLKLAKDLLTEDGVIFISIDDNEQANLKLLCDEIFGEENFVEIFNLQVRYANKSLNEKDNFQKLMEYCFIYAKDKKLFKPNKKLVEYDINKFEYEIIEKEQGKTIYLGSKKVTIFSKNQYEIIKHKKGSTTLLKGTWASGSVLKGNTSGKFFANYLENRKSIDGLSTLYKVEGIGNDGIGYRYFTGAKKETATKGIFYSGVPLDILVKLEQNGKAEKTMPIINFYDYSGDFGNINHEGGVSFKSGKKPIKMLSNLINIVIQHDKESLILDFFAGSGTTGHSVMQLNKEDGGNRKYIMVQIDESIDKSKEGYKFCVDNNLEPVISSITIERINRAGEKLLQEQQEETKEVTPLDIGYKVFSLIEKPKLAEEENGNYELIHNHEKSIDIIYNMLSKADKLLDSKIEEIEKDSLYKVEDGYYIINNISEVDIQALKDSKIYIDGYSNIQLEKFLNLLNRNNINKDSVKILY